MLLRGGGILAPDRSHPSVFLVGSPGHCQTGCPRAVLRGNIHVLLRVYFPRSVRTGYVAISLGGKV